MEDETSVWVCWGIGGCGALKRSRTHARSYTHRWPALAWFWSVARGHGGHRSQLSACDGLIQTPPAPQTPTLRSDTPKPPPLSLAPSSLLPPSFLPLRLSSRPMPGGHVWEEMYWGGRASLHLDCGLHLNMPSCHPHSAALWPSYLLAVLATRLGSLYHFIWPADSSLLEISPCLLSWPMGSECLTLCSFK